MSAHDYVVFPSIIRPTAGLQNTLKPEKLLMGNSFWNVINAPFTGLERQRFVQSGGRWGNIWTLAARNKRRESGLVGFVTR